MAIGGTRQNFLILGLALLCLLFSARAHGIAPHESINDSQELDSFLNGARDDARKHRAPTLTAERMFSFFLDVHGEQIIPLLKKAKAERVATELVPWISDVARAETKVGGTESYRLEHAGDADSILDFAQAAAKVGALKSDDGKIRLDHLLYAFVASDTALSRTLRDRFKASKPELEAALKEEGKPKVFVGKGTESGRTEEQEFRAATRSLTQWARDNKHQRAVGRGEEIENILITMGKSTKNVSVVLGEPGVGKTAAGEELAHLAISDNPPEMLAGREVVWLDLARLSAGTRYRGDFEERLGKILKYLEKNHEKFVVLIDEAHTIVGTGNADGGNDASNMLKPVLARDSFRCVMFTTLDEFRKHLEKDPAFGRRLQPVHFEPLNKEQTMAVLRIRWKFWEKRHDVQITEAALKAAYEWSQAHITGKGKNQPDKALDVVDTACSMVALQRRSGPSVIRRTSEEIATWKSQEGMLETVLERNPDDADAKEALAGARKEIARLKLELAQYEANRDAAKAIQDDIDRLAREFSELDAKVRAGESVHENEPLRTRKEQELQAKRAQLARMAVNKGVVFGVVDVPAIAMAMAKITGQKQENFVLDKDTTEKYANLEADWSRSVIGQPELIETLALAARELKSQFGSKPGPIEGFLILGPSGSGKTKTAQVVGASLRGVPSLQASELIYAHCGDFTGKGSETRLNGAPPGHVGYDKPPVLYEQTLNNKADVILLDELHRGDPEIITTWLMKVMDSGRIVWNDKHANAFNKLLLMTSSLGQEYILDPTKKDADGRTGREAVLALARLVFGADFMNRVTVVFTTPADPDARLKIVEVLLQELVRDKLNGMKVTSTRAARQLLNEQADKVGGARALMALLKKHVRGPLVNRDVIQKDVLKGDEYELRVVEKGEERSFELVLVKRNGEVVPPPSDGGSPGSTAERVPVGPQPLGPSTVGPQPAADTRRTETTDPRPAERPGESREGERGETLSSLLPGGLAPGREACADVMTQFDPERPAAPPSSGQ